jgi:heat shock protein HtpX
MNLLTEEELTAVMAHEMGHVRNRDTLISAIVATMAGAISQLGWILMFTGLGGRSEDDDGAGAFGGLFAIIVAPILAMLIQFAISRSREYGADETGAALTGNPLALASALRKLQRGAELRPMNVNPSTSHLFIVNPLSGRDIGNLFSTHPPLEQRIARLEQMAYRMSGGHRW